VAYPIYHYDGLPLAVQAPTGWQPLTPEEADAEAAINLIRKVVHTEFHSLVLWRLAQGQLATWRNACARDLSRV
jgi:hypothetical protein